MYMERSDIVTPSRKARLLYHTEYHYYCESVSSNCVSVILIHWLIINCCVKLLLLHDAELEICPLFVVKSLILATFLKFRPPAWDTTIDRRSFLDAITTTIEERRWRAIREGRFHVHSSRRETKIWGEWVNGWTVLIFMGLILTAIIHELSSPTAQISASASNTTTAVKRRPAALYWCHII